MPQNNIQKNTKRPKRKKKKQEEFRSLLEEMIRNSEGEPTEYFGYSKECQPNESPFELPSEGVVCMVSNIVEKNQQQVIETSGINFVLGQWFVSQNNDFNEVTVYGPFEDESEALDYGRERLGVVSYRSPSIFEVY